MEGGEGRVTNPSNLMPISQFNVNRSPSPPSHMMRQKFCFPKHPPFASKPFEELNISRNIALSWCNANSSSIVELDLNLILNRFKFELGSKHLFHNCQGSQSSSTSNEVHLQTQSFVENLPCYTKPFQVTISLHLQLTYTKCVRGRRAPPPL